MVGAIGVEKKHDVVGVYTGEEYLDVTYGGFLVEARRCPCKKVGLTSNILGHRVVEALTLLYVE